MGAQWIHPSVHAAVQHCIRHRKKEGSERENDDDADGKQLQTGNETASAASSASSAGGSEGKDDHV